MIKRRDHNRETTVPLSSRAPIPTWAVAVIPSTAVTGPSNPPDRIRMAASAETPKSHCRISEPISQRRTPTSAASSGEAASTFPRRIHSTAMAIVTNRAQTMCKKSGSVPPVCLNQAPRTTWTKVARIADQVKRGRFAPSGETTGRASRQASPLITNRMTTTTKTSCAQVPCRKASCWLFSSTRVPPSRP